jgi:hypothetical protein
MPHILQEQVASNLEDFEGLSSKEADISDPDQPRSLLFIDASDGTESHQANRDGDLNQLDVTPNTQSLIEKEINYDFKGPQSQVNIEQTVIEHIFNGDPTAVHPISAPKIDPSFLNNLSINNSKNSEYAENFHLHVSNTNLVNETSGTTILKYRQSSNDDEGTLKFESTQTILITESINISNTADSSHSVFTSSYDMKAFSDPSSFDNLQFGSFSTSTENATNLENVGHKTEICQIQKTSDVNLFPTDSYEQSTNESIIVYDDSRDEPQVKEVTLRELESDNINSVDQSDEVGKHGQHSHVHSDSDVLLGQKMNPTMYGKMVKTLRHQFKRILSLGVKNDKSSFDSLKKKESNHIDDQHEAEVNADSKTLIAPSSLNNSPITQVVPENSKSNRSHQSAQSSPVLLESYRMYSSMSIDFVVSFLFVMY